MYSAEKSNRTYRPTRYLGCEQTTDAVIFQFHRLRECLSFLSPFFLFLSLCLYVFSPFIYVTFKSPCSYQSHGPASRSFNIAILLAIVLGAAHERCIRTDFILSTSYMGRNICLAATFDSPIKTIRVTRPFSSSSAYPPSSVFPLPRTTDPILAQFAARA